MTVKVCTGMLPLVAAGTPENGNTIGAATPGPSGPWMCEIVAGLVVATASSLLVFLRDWIFTAAHHDLHLGHERQAGETNRRHE